MIFHQHMIPFWDDEFRRLDYQREPFNDPDSLRKWKKQGYTQKYYVGQMCDMRKNQPSWNHRVIQYFTKFGFGMEDWNDVSTSYYRMETGVVLPMHSDLYTRYKHIHELHSKPHTVFRAVVFLEDRKPGHILEIGGEAKNWKAGDYVVWTDDEEHSAANIGIQDRYTLQVTGWINV